MTEYGSPVDRLLNYRATEFGEDWPDYVAEFGFGPEQIRDLTLMATDPDLYREDVEGLPAFAPIHARRALGQLRAEEAVRPLLAAMDQFNDMDDYWLEEMPEILCRIGPAAIPALAECLSDSSADEYTRIGCTSALRDIGREYPETREECVRLLTDRIDAKGEALHSLNGFLISALVDLKAVESAPVIEEAFRAGGVDEVIRGDWPVIRYELGFRPMPMTRRYDRARIFREFDNQEARRRPDLKKLQRKAKKQARKLRRKRR